MRAHTGYERLPNHIGKGEWQYFTAMGCQPPLNLGELGLD